MLTKVRIQNYKSIRDVTVDLQQVNLLIGANNSGKTNFLKALEFFGKFLLEGFRPEQKDLNRIFFNQEEVDIKGKDSDNPLAITFWGEKQVYKLEIYSFQEGQFSFSEFVGQIQDRRTIKINFQINDIDYICDNFYSYYIQVKSNFYYKYIHFQNDEFRKVIENTINDIFLLYKHNPNSDLIKENDIYFSLLNRLTRFNTDRFPISSDIINALSQIQVFKPDPNKLTNFYPIKGDDKITNDCSNLVSYMDRLRDTNPKVFAQIQENLNKCIPEFVGIRFDTDYNNGNGTLRRIGLSNLQDNIFWADELSEGTLYFLCLLCIIHQPNPPKLLLLEELEKGIHPVRIQEVVNFIFRLAEEKDIQIIMTSHHPLVLEEFKDIPESVFIFDKTSEGSTVKNLLHDVIEVEDEKRKEKGLPKTNYVSSLSDHWTVGLIGGVPR